MNVKSTFLSLYKPSLIMMSFCLSLKFVSELSVFIVCLGYFKSVFISVVNCAFLFWCCSYWVWISGLWCFTKWVAGYYLHPWQHLCKIRTISSLNILNCQESHLGLGALIDGYVDIFWSPHSISLTDYETLWVLYSFWIRYSEILFV